MPRNPRLINKFEIRFIYRRGRLQSVIAVFAPHIIVRDTPQLLLDNGKKFIQRIFIAVRPSRQEFGNLSIVVHSRDENLTKCKFCGYFSRRKIIHQTFFIKTKIIYKFLSFLVR